jgi:hypothetical protein
MGRFYVGIITNKGRNNNFSNNKAKVPTIATQWFLRFKEVISKIRWEII